MTAKKVADCLRAALGKPVHETCNYGGKFGQVVGCIIAGGIDYAANKYDKVAKDPPRFDFDVVDVFHPVAVSVPNEGDANGALRVFAILAAQSGVAMSRLVAALERLGGLEASSTGNNEEVSAQLRAGSNAARAGAGLLDQILGSAAATNSAWAATKPTVTDTLTPEQKVVAFHAAWSQVLPTLQATLNLNDADFAEMVAAVDAAVTPDAFADTLGDVLLTPGVVSTFEEAANALRALAAEFDSQQPPQALAVQEAPRGKALPFTGGPATFALLGVALLLLAIGGSAISVVRRRRGV